MGSEFPLLLELLDAPSANELRIARVLDLVRKRIYVGLDASEDVELETLGDLSGMSERMLMLRGAAVQSEVQARGLMKWVRGRLE